MISRILLLHKVLFFSLKLELNNLDLIMRLPNKEKMMLMPNIKVIYSLLVMHLMWLPRWQRMLNSLQLL